MTRRERLMATLRGEPVDRPPISFYGIGGKKMLPEPHNEFAVWNDPSWRPLVNLAEEKTDLIRGMYQKWSNEEDAGFSKDLKSQVWREGRSQFTRRTLTVPGRTLTSLMRRDVNINTVWTLEHFLTDADDLKAYLQLTGGASRSGSPMRAGWWLTGMSIRSNGRSR